MSSLKFGTSGLRGLVTDLLGRPAFSYALAFLRTVKVTGARQVLIGRDLRSSSPELAGLCAEAALAAGFTPIDCGEVPTPALALEAMRRGCPAIMVTGSHIPDDRNGLKFYRVDGEITKADEAAILDAFQALTGTEAVEKGAAAQADALTPYIRRYLDFFSPDALQGLTVGVYQQSTVARDVLVEVLEGLGARAKALGRADRFIPVDTEAHREEDKALIAGWAAEGGLDAIVAADGDADRPLVADETGRILRGDILGLLTAKLLGVRTIVTPVTSSSAIETAGVADRVVRTRVGSPFVIAGMGEATGEGGVVGFEANGGLLLGSSVTRNGRTLAALPTRDAVLPILAVLTAAREAGTSLGDLVASLRAGFAAAHRLPDVPAEASAQFLVRLGDDAAFRDALVAPVGSLRAVDRTDGVRLALADGSVVHYRASGNAPELRCYVEAPSEDGARALLEWGLGVAERALRA